MKSIKIPKAALNFQSGQMAEVMLGDGEDALLQLNMTVYSGGIVEHWWWDNLAIDLSGGTFSKSKYPVLENHWTDSKIAFTGKPTIDKSIRLNPDSTKFVSTPESEKFQRLSQEGFPYEASGRFRPMVIERVKEGSFVDVNGFKLKGPATVFRKWQFIEASVCVFGADRNTKSAAFSEGDTEFEEIDVELSGDGELPAFNSNNVKEEVDEKMNIAELKEKYPELFKEIQDESEAVFSAEKKELKDANQALTGEVADLKASLDESEKDNKELGKRVVVLEAKDKVRDEEDAKNKADGIFSEKLEASQVPEKMYKRVERGIKVEQFIKEGALDDVAFGEAVDAEIKDWEADGYTEKVLGTGFSGKSDIDTEVDLRAAEEKEDDAAVDEMLALAGEEAEAN